MRRSDEQNIFYRLFSWSTWLYAKLFFRLKVIYPSDKRDFFKRIGNGPVIIAPNHASYLDPPLICAVWPKALHFFASSHLFAKSSWFSWALKQLYCHPVKRESGVAALKEAIRLISQEELSIVIFPEGTRSSDGRMRMLQEGVSYIAMKSKVPIIPIYIEGAFDAWPRGSFFPRLFGRISLKVLDPIYPELEDGSSKKGMMNIHQKLETAFSAYIGNGN